MAATETVDSMMEMEMKQSEKKNDNPKINDANNNNNNANDSRLHIEIVKPHDTQDIDAIENLSDETVEKLVQQNARAKLPPKLVRVVAMILLAFESVAIMAWTEEDFHVTKVFSVGLGTMFVLYFAHIYYLISHSKQAYRIYSLSSPVKDWTTMPITYRAIQYRSYSIGSISEFSAIGGGVANQMLMALGLTVMTTVLVQEVNNVWFEKIWLSFTNNLLCNSCKQKSVIVFDGEVDDFFIFFGAFGLALLGIFELDPFSKILPKLHYFGGLLGLGTVIGFTIQQVYIWEEAQSESSAITPNYFGLFWCSFFCVSAVISFFLWTYYFSNKAESFTKEIMKNPNTYNQNEINKQIRRNTIYNIVSESIFLMSGAFSLCLWLWYFNELNPSFKSTNGGVLPSGGPWKFYFDFIVDKYQCDTLYCCDGAEKKLC